MLRRSKIDKWYIYTYAWARIKETFVHHCWCEQVCFFDVLYDGGWFACVNFGIVKNTLLTGVILIWWCIPSCFPLWNCTKNVWTSILIVFYESYSSTLIFFRKEFLKRKNTAKKRRGDNRQKGLPQTFLQCSIVPLICSATKNPQLL